MVINPLVKSINLHSFPGVRQLVRKFSDMRLPKEDVIVASNGMQMLVRNPHISSIGRTVYLTGMWEPEVTKFISTKIQPGFSILDIGADIGYYSLLFSKLVGQKGHVFAFEPIPKAKDYLDKNVNINKISNVKTFGFALFDRAGMVCLEEPLVESKINLEKQVLSSKDIQVEMKVFDEWKLQEGIDKVDLVKLDVEGAELNILRGMRNTLQDLRPAILIEVHPKKLPSFGFSASDVMEFLSDLGYQTEPVDKTKQGEITLFCECKDTKKGGHQLDK